jgi:hypothetical protein
MTCKELSGLAEVIGVVVIGLMGILAIVAWISILFSEPQLPVECVDGQAYEITIKGNIKYLDEIVGTKCEVVK